MEKQPLQHSTLIYILAIISLPLCCCAGVGAITAGVAYYLASTELKKFYANPEIYSNQDNIYTGKIIALVILIINVLYLIYTVYVIYTVGWDDLMLQSEEMMKDFQ
jgi:amino acid transporter